MLCSHCKHSCLKQVSLDTIGNLALQFIMEPIQIFSTQLVLRLVTRCLASDDKFEIVRGKIKIHFVFHYIFTVFVMNINPFLFTL